MRIKIIVEGESDRIFLSNLIKFLKKQKIIKNSLKIEVEISNGSKIINRRNIKKIIENAKEDNYERILILIDKKIELGSQFRSRDCLLDVKNIYKKKILNNVNNTIEVIVVDSEIECWFVLGSEKVKNFHIHCYENARELFGTNAKIQLAKRATTKLNLIFKNRNKNKSFNHFLRKIGVYDIKNM